MHATCGHRFQLAKNVEGDGTKIIARRERDYSNHARFPATKVGRRRLVGARYAVAIAAARWDQYAAPDLQRHG